MTRTRYRFVEDKAPHFLTCTAVNWLPLFANPDIVRILLDSLSFLQKQRRLIVYGFVIMENHLHMISSADDISKEVGDFKSFTARKVIDYLTDNKASSILTQLKINKPHHKEDSAYQFWQEGSHPQLIQSEEMMRQKLEYMHYNPIRRGYIDEPVHWRYSSARNYAGLDGILEVCTGW